MTTRAIPKWMWAVLVVPLVFVVWSVSLLYSVSRQREKVVADHAIAGALSGLDRSLRELEAPLLEPGPRGVPEALRQDWPALARGFEEALGAARGAGATLPAMVEKLEPVEGHYRRLDELRRTLEGEPPLEQVLATEMEFRLEVNRGLEALGVARRVLSDRIQKASRMLDRDWSRIGMSLPFAGLFGLVAALLLLSRQREVYQRRLTEEGAIRQRNILRSVLDNMGEGVVVADEEGRFILFNPTAERIIGIGATDSTPEEWQEVYGLFRADNLEPVPADQLPLARAIRGESCHEFEMFLRNAKVPEGIFISVTATPLVGDDGTQRGGVAVLRDITERREAEAARQAQELARYLQEAREKERGAIAREIHDELGQALTGLKLECSFLGRKLQDPELVRRSLSSMTTLIDETIGSVRRMAAELRPRILDELGLFEAIRWQATEFQRRTGCRCELVLPEGDLELSRDRATAMFRILQEALTNVARHAGASEVSIRVRVDEERVQLDVRDDGRGISEEELHGSRSFGLLGMRERARMFDGLLTLGNHAESGTLVHAEIPLGSPAAEAGDGDQGPTKSV